MRPSQRNVYPLSDACGEGEAAIAHRELQFGPGVEDDLDPVEEDHASPDA
ncbi:hypothetical protein F2Q70_00004327 [Brassica cretica]|uniref:Uncharacterized protein n=1 Tax=Brassica cretica TaxID=69181 RepID=A0A8S9IP20_BRACR|nr:hypothetical protein F2Q70_00004327 [Brassica cretica]